jgi:hypothetical protein
MARKETAMRAAIRLRLFFIFGEAPFQDGDDVLSDHSG